MPKTQKAITETVTFFDILNMPLREKDIWQYLWRHEANFDEVRVGLNYLISQNKLDKAGDFYVLPGRGHDLVLKYTEARSYEARLWRQVKRAKRWLQWLPFIRGVMVCNSLAFGNVHRNSDIDLLIVVEPGHLWHARFLATVSMHYKRLRRHGKKVAGRICLSFFVTTDALEFSKMKIAEDDVYLSYWVRTLKPVFGIETYKELLMQNEWIKRDIPNFTHERIYSLMPRSPIAAWYQRIDESFMKTTGLAWLCEKMLRAWMKPRSEKKAAQLGPEAGAVVTDQMNKFHDRDRREEIRTRWRNKLASQS